MNSADGFTSSIFNFSGENEGISEGVSDEEDNLEPNSPFVGEFSSPESTSTIILEPDTDSEVEEPPVLKKTKPKHSWYANTLNIHETLE